jgi:plasmid stability protein
MKTLYLRNVPERTAKRLARLAAREGLSVSAFAVRVLGEVAQRADNPDLLAELPNLGISADEVVSDLERAREKRR